MSPRRDPVVSFWKKVNKSEACWEWNAARDRKGYGKFWDGNFLWLAHRYSWKLHFGPILGDTMILHKCNNPGCVNPNHLYAGDNCTNMLDAIKAGTHSTPYIRKLDDAAVTRIRDFISQGKSHGEISAICDVSTTTVSRIRNRIIPYGDNRRPPQKRF